MEIQSASIAKLADALAKFQTKLLPAKKSADNPFFKSKYADLAGVVDAARTAGLGDLGLSVAQIPTREDGAFVLVTTLMHTSGEWLRGVYPISPIKNDPQSMGSAVTYARRYAYQSILGIPAEDDDGNAASGNGNGNGKHDPLPQGRQGFPDARAEAEAINRGEAPYVGGSEVNHERAKIAKANHTMSGKPASDKSRWKLFFDLKNAGYEWPRTEKGDTPAVMSNVDAVAIQITGHDSVTALTLSEAIKAVEQKGLAAIPFGGDSQEVPPEMESEQIRFDDDDIPF